MRPLFTFLFLCTFLQTYATDMQDTIRLYFDFGIAKLNNTTEHSIDSILYNDVLVPGKKLAIVGYADHVGTDTSNVLLSEARAKNVAAYLETRGIAKTDIQIVTGKGEVNRPGIDGNKGYQPDRRVDIIPGGIPEPAKAPAKPKQLTLDISKLKKNETIRMDNIYFLPGSHFIRDESWSELKKLYATMVEYPTLKIRIEGHICCMPDATDGYDHDAQEFGLSVNRAKFIYEYLIKKGIKPDRLEYAGFGRTRPLVKTERTPEDENRNRRVEIRILEM